MDLTIIGDNSGIYEDLVLEYIKFRGFETYNIEAELRIFIYEDIDELNRKTNKNEEINEDEICYAFIKRINDDRYFIWIAEHDMGILKYEENTIISLFHEVEHFLQYTCIYEENFIVKCSYFREFNDFSYNSYLLDTTEIGAKYYSKLGYRFISGNILFDQDVLDHYSKYNKYNIWELEALIENIEDKIEGIENSRLFENLVSMDVLESSIRLIESLLVKFKSIIC